MNNGCRKCEGFLPDAVVIWDVVVDVVVGVVGIVGVVVVEVVVGVVGRAGVVVVDMVAGLVVIVEVPSGKSRSWVL